MKKIIILITFSTLLLGACSNANRQVVNLVGKDFRFTPDVIQVEEGNTIVINFSNPDSVPHLIYLPEFEQHIGLPPGNEFTLEFVVDKTGTFEFICNVPGHLEAGMTGLLVVEPKNK